MYILFRLMLSFKIIFVPSPYNEDYVPSFDPHACTPPLQKPNEGRGSQGIGSMSVAWLDIILGLQIICVLSISERKTFNLI